jgi:hypothetical protein
MKLDYAVIILGGLLGLALIAMAVDTARRMRMDAPEPEETPDAG